MRTIDRLKAVIILLNGSIPVPEYPFERFELDHSPVAYYKNVIVRLISKIDDEFYARENHCSSRDCGCWGSASCKDCASYHDEVYPIPEVQELYI